jgi:DNA-binding winged helix-turn-helix (wHTH) protein
MHKPRVGVRRELNDEGFRVRQRDSTLGSIMSALRVGAIRHDVVDPTMGRFFRRSPYRIWKFLRTFSALDCRGGAPYYRPDVIEFPPYRLDARAGRLWRGRQSVSLRPKTWELLRYLVERPGALVTKDELHAAIWGDTVVSDDTLSRTLAELRMVLQDDARSPRIIETVHRRGFRFIAQVHGPSESDPSGDAPDAPGPMPEARTSTLVGREAEMARLWGLFQQAIVFLEQAARRNYGRHAFGDVVACLEPALRLIAELPETPERARNELGLRQLYAITLSQSAGYAANALLKNLERAQDLCERLADPAALFDVLCGLVLLHSNGGELPRAELVGERLPKLAEGLGPSAVLQNDFLRGAVALWGGKLNAAESLLGGVLSSPASLEDGDRPYGVNPMVAARSFEGLRRWIVGDSAGARAVQEEALALSERSRRPFSVAHATTFSALLLAVEEDWAEAERLATLGIDLSTEYGFPRWRGTALAARGRALVEQGHESQGLAEIREGIDELGRAGMRLGNSLLFSLFAGACLRLKKLDEGLAATDAGLAHCRDTSDRLFEAELWRLRGAFVELGSRRGKDAPAGTIPEAEECFDRARALARAQGAHMLGRRVRPGNAGPAVRRASG